MGLQKRYTERRKEPGPALVMHPCYVTSLIKEPSNYEEETEKKEWKDDMIKEY